MKKYGKYKSSGIEWLGDIPEHWRIAKLKYQTELTGDNISVEELEGKKLIHYSIPNIQEFGTGVIEEGSDISSSKIRLYGGEVLISKLNPRKSTICIVNEHVDELVVCSGEMVVFKPKNFHAKFLFYMLKNQNFTEYLNSQVESATKSHQRVRPDVIYNSEFPNISLTEQYGITSFLDLKTTQIDTLIKRKEQLIDKLKLQRQAIINETVTKGLNPNAKMKDSSIEWLGEIVQEWPTIRIKHSCYVKGRIGWKGLKSEEYLDEGYSYLVTGTDFTGQIVDWKSCHCIDKERYDEDPYIQLRNGDLLITKDGTIGKTTLVKNLDKPACLNSGIFLVRSLIAELDINFLYWILNSNVFKVFIELTSSGATIQHLYQNVFVEFEFALPPLHQQIEIQKYLFIKYNEFEELLKKLNVSIDKLKLYRQSLISEAVTGKIDVREWVNELN